MNKYSLVNYFDVWGDEKEGWIVNNQCILLEGITITDDADPKDILKYLKDLGYLSTTDMRRIEVVDNGDVIEINEKKGHRPLFAFIPEAV